MPAQGTGTKAWQGLREYPGAVLDVAHRVLLHVDADVGERRASEVAFGGKIESLMRFAKKEQCALREAINGLGPQVSSGVINRTSFALFHTQTVYI